MKQNWYQLKGSKFKEAITMFHLPYTGMCLAFLVVGFAIHKPVNWLVLTGALISYMCGLGIGAHFLDQIPGQGTRYVEQWNKNELLLVGVLSLAIACGLGVCFIIGWRAIWMIPLMIAQGFFAVAYPVAKLFAGFFHTDFWFAVGFGFMPVFVGFYANNLSFSWLILPFGLLCFLISLIEITLSRFARNARKAGLPYHHTPEKALKFLCLLSYVFAITILLC